MEDANLPNWLNINTPEKLQEWLNKSQDPNGSYDKLVSLWENSETSKARWIIAAVITGNSAYQLSEDLLNSKWDKERLETDLEYLEQLQARVLEETRSSFNEATGLYVLKEGRFAAGSEDVDIIIGEDEQIESVGDYWVAASNYSEPGNGQQDQIYTLWNVAFEDSCLVVFEYVKNSLEELTLECNPRLNGADLLAKVEECSALSKSKIALACGYSKVGLDGKVKPAFTAFYEALLNAKMGEPEEVNYDPLSCFAGTDLSEVVLNADLIKAITDGGRMLEELSEEEAAHFVRRVVTSIRGAEPTLFSLTYFDADDSKWIGYVESKEWTLSFGEDDEGATLVVSDIEYEKQFSEIQEILAGADRERPGLEDFFEVMALRMRDEEMSFDEAWNVVVFDAQGSDSALGKAMADFRGGELYERLGYEPSSDALDDALDQWIRNFY
jgi:hypothetical protein